MATVTKLADWGRFYEDQGDPRHHVFVYHLNPIDFWEGWLTEEKYLRQLVAASSFPGVCGEQLLDFQAKAVAEDVLEYLDFRDQSFALARHVGWEGDHGTVWVSALPVSTCSKCPVVLAWKQSNNGETFVASPMELPWMKTMAVEVVAHAA